MGPTCPHHATRGGRMGLTGGLPKWAQAPLALFPHEKIDFLFIFMFLAFGRKSSLVLVLFLFCSFSVISLFGKSCKVRVKSH